MRMNYLKNYVNQHYKNVDGWGVDDDLIDIILLIDDFQKKKQSLET